LRKRTDDGSTRQAHLEAAAARGSVRAQAELAGPPFPDALGYLWDIFERLDTMRAVGMNGLERFTPQHIQAGAALFGWELAPYEVEGLVALDLATMYPESAEPTVTEGKPATAWPTRKE